MSNRELLMLAQPYVNQEINGWYVSEKLDGQRAFWDGGVSRGRPTWDVPWANLNKHVHPVATGLWSRYGNVIKAPDEWLDRLPVGVLLDGELWTGNLQTLRTIVSKHVACAEKWAKVDYAVFGSPGDEFCRSGTINNPNFQRAIDAYTVQEYLRVDTVNRPFQQDYEYLKTLEGIKIVPQFQLPWNEAKAKDIVFKYVDEIVAEGGEGVMLRHPRSMWVPKRSNMLLKVKPMKDDECVIVGVVPGLGRLVGMMGALTVKWNNKTFEIGTGFTDDERREKWTVGEKITFKYTSLTNEGVPREARYFRRYDEN
jgi:DNA ligase 1